MLTSTSRAKSEPWEDEKEEEDLSIKHREQVPCCDLQQSLLLSQAPCFGQSWALVVIYSTKPCLRDQYPSTSTDHGGSLGRWLRTGDINSTFNLLTACDQGPTKQA